MTTVEIGNAGESLVSQDLKQRGYTNIVQDTFQPGAVDVKADHTKGNVLIQVKTSVSPGQPADLSTEEKTKIKQRALNNKRTAYSAQLQINNSKQLVGQIKYTPL